MISAEFIDNVQDQDWSRTRRINIGRKTISDTPNVSVGVKSSEWKRFILKIFADGEYCCFNEMRVIGNNVVIGHVEHVHFFDPDHIIVKSIKLDGYFGHLYTPIEFGRDDIEFCLLVASAMYLYHFTNDGIELWKSDVLGIDGVIVNHVSSKYIDVSGEWDPPGGWKETRLNIKDGTEMTDLISF